MCDREEEPVERRVVGAPAGDGETQLVLLDAVRVTDELGVIGRRVARLQGHLDADATQRFLDGRGPRPANADVDVTDVRGESAGLSTGSQRGLGLGDVTRLVGAARIRVALDIR